MSGYLVLEDATYALTQVPDSVRTYLRRSVLDLLVTEYDRLLDDDEGGFLNACFVLQRRGMRRRRRSPA